MTICRLAGFTAGLLQCVVVARAQEPPPQPERNRAKRIMRIQVVDVDGRPLARTNIHASVWTKEPFKANRDYWTNDEGMAAVELPTHLTILRLWARKKSHAPLFAQWWKDRQPDGHLIPETFTFRLERGIEVGGFVRNEDGDPVAGAKVEVQRDAGRGGVPTITRPVTGMWLAEGDDDPFGALTTGKDGRWTLDNVPDDGALLRVKLSHPDYIDDTAWGGLQKEQNVTRADLEERSATIVMKRGVRVRGVVIDPQTRKRVPNAVIVWGDDPYFETGSQEVRTDETGFYQLPPLAPQTLTLTCIAEGWAPQMKIIKVEKGVADATLRVDASFRLQRGRTVRLKFVDPKGNPIPGVGVGIDSWRGKKSLYNHRHPNVLNTKIPTRADKNGIYEWTWAPRDAVKYQFYKEGFEDFSAVELEPTEEPRAVQLRRISLLNRLFGRE